MNEEITPIGQVNYRKDDRVFGIRDKDRFAHIYCIGKTGTGKSTLLQNMLVSDIRRGHGCALIDPHGDIAEDILNYIPVDRIEDVIYFNPADTEFPMGFNPLKNVHPRYQHVIASGLISVFKKMWADHWGMRLEHILRNCLLTLLEYRQGSLLDIHPLLTDQGYRNLILAQCANPHRLAFWRQEFEKYSPSFRSEAIAPILNKVGLFTNDLVKNIIGQKERSFRLEDVMDNGMIFIANLSKGKLGEDVSTLLGSILVTSMQVTALQRAGQPEYTRRPFFLYVDECHSFISRTFVDILSEARKYKLSLFLAHQHLEQFNDETRAAVFGNVGTFITFRIGSADARYVVREFDPPFMEQDLVNLPKFHLYIKLMIDGQTSTPFSAKTLPILAPKGINKDHLIQISRKQFASDIKQYHYDALQRNRIDSENIGQRLF